MATLSLQKVTKVYDNGFEAVHGFSLDIKEKEFIVLVGPSGCGKSTTLRMIAGLEEITKGKFFIDDRLVNNVSPRERGIAMVFQSYALYPNMSVYENLAFGLNLEGMDEDIIDNKVKETAAILGLTPLLERRPRALSGGQRQRVALGRAIIRHVGVFLMDEPLSNLDAKQRVTMRSEIIKIHRKIGTTTIYVTHDQTEAMTMADRIVCMKEGYIQQIGTPKELYFDPANLFVAGFIGEPPMNFLHCDVSGGKLNAADLKLDVSSAFGKVMQEFEGKKLVAGFRPEGACLQAPKGAHIVLPCVVNVTEFLGDYVNVYARVADTDIIVKTSPENEPQIGAEIDVFVPLDGLYLFDPQTEERVREG